VQAKSPSSAPALDVPPPPPHIVELPAEPLDPVGEVPNPSAPPPTRPGRPAPREAPPKPDASKSESPKADTPPAASPPPPDPVPVLPPPPNPQLRTPQTADTSAAAKSVQKTIDSAKNTLLTVNYLTLSNERKKAYDDAKLFIQQAENALKEGNIVFAQANAGKAETLARELAGR
jgi:hypothetical protein